MRNLTLGNKVDVSLFRLTENGRYFSVVHRNNLPADPFGGWLPDFDQVLELGHTMRLCRVTKTRAYVVVDEDESGPVVETWGITPRAFFD